MKTLDKTFLKLVGNDPFFVDCIDCIPDSKKRAFIVNTRWGTRKIKRMEEKTLSLIK